MEVGGNVSGWHVNPFDVPPGQVPADEAVICLDIAWKAIEVGFSLGLVALTGGFKHPSNLLLADPSSLFVDFNSSTSCGSPHNSSFWTHVPR